MNISEDKFLTTFECPLLPLYGHSIIKLDHSQIVALKTLKNLFKSLDKDPFKDLDDRIYSCFNKVIKYFTVEQMPEIKQLFKYVTLFIYNFNKLYSFDKYRLILADLEIPSYSSYINVNFKYHFILRDITTKKFSKKFVGISFYPFLDYQIKRMQDIFEYKALILKQRLENTFSKVSIDYSIICYSKIRSENKKILLDHLKHIDIKDNNIKDISYYTKYFETYVILNQYKLKPYCTNFTCVKRSDCFK